MKFKNINHPEEIVNFREATVKGLGKNKGLFVPLNIPTLSKDFFDTIESKNNTEIAFEVMKHFVGESLSNEELKTILNETFSFEIPVKHIAENRYVLELFHGPTMAFKDVGARFMARCLGKFTNKTEKVTVLVATSGDTGSAVAQGFFNVDGVRVVILFPKGKVSQFQEFQMTSLGKNIEAIEVNGNFDDCQALVKQALQDQELAQKIQLSSANSINVARFLPQMLYYFFAYKQLKSKFEGKNWVVSVPSGNFGNLTAGLYAQKMGLPISRFVASNNENDTFYEYLQSGKYQPKASVQTFSNAMDVGAPSNFERILDLFGNNYQTIKENIKGGKVTDAQILAEIDLVWHEDSYQLDPHGAVGHRVLKKFLEDDEVGTVLATAHPKKFADVMQKVIPDFQSPSSDLSKCSKKKINVDYDEYRVILLEA